MLPETIIAKLGCVDGDAGEWRPSHEFSVPRRAAWVDEIPGAEQND